MNQHMGDIKEKKVFLRMSNKYFSIDVLFLYNIDIRLLEIRSI